MLTSRNISIIGAGAWGTSLAIHTARLGLPVRLWARRPEMAATLSQARVNEAFLPGFPLPPGVSLHNDPVEAVAEAAIIIWVVPSHGLREVARRFRSYLPPGVFQISATKGIEDDTFATMTEILREETQREASSIGVLSGPSFAREVAAGLPTAVTLAFLDLKVARLAQALLSAPVFRVYSSQDVKGVELGGAMKNVYAIAAGICDGLNLGLNARAAFLTRALAEMTRLAVAVGANPLTISGLSGLGDLLLTATGDLSRNRRVGLRLGAGEPLSSILANQREVAEGVNNSRAVWGLAQKLGLSLPTIRETFRVLHEGKDPRQGLVDLLTRRLKDELPSSLRPGGKPDD
ncbi:MAG: NAD(P)-dependent glycerol-3-phosphate dehydrogenase [Deltaproteobacteria bacterium]|jgi:glycerol-3-phosphate dehydrogenase (NAD(P)+)|nr:NAD(P)-dependent glycerol-3-phosphate dehydrogenase [Deltaproteobacteria bacterium]